MIIEFYQTNQSKKMKNFTIISFLILFFSCNQDISKSENEILIDRNNSIVTKNFQAYKDVDKNFEFMSIFHSTFSLGKSKLIKIPFIKSGIFFNCAISNSKV